MMKNRNCRCINCGEYPVVNISSIGLIHLHCPQCRRRTSWVYFSLTQARKAWNLRNKRGYAKGAA